MQETLLTRLDGFTEVRSRRTVDVVVLIDAPDLQPTYTYAIPPELQEPEFGSTLVVSFGQRTVLGFVVGHGVCGEDSSGLKEIDEVLNEPPAFTRHQWELAKFVAERYVCSTNDAIRCLVPSVFTAKLDRVVTLIPDMLQTVSKLTVPQTAILGELAGSKSVMSVDLLKQRLNLPAFQQAFTAIKRKGLVEVTSVLRKPKSSIKMVRQYQWHASTIENLKLPQQNALDRIKATIPEGVPHTLQQLRAASGISESEAKNLEKHKALVSTMARVRRTPSTRPIQSLPFNSLMPSQQNSIRIIRESIRGEAGRFLLHGITASGKTEVYLHTMEAALAMGKSVMLLVPEIALTTQIVDILVGRFGDKVAILHSRLSQGERHDEWQRIMSGEATVVVGARSAVFAPVTNLGLVIVDEEHEGSYKQDNAPRYQARDVAVKLASLHNATVLLGSATPSLEAYFSTEQGRMTRLELNERVDQRPLPVVKVIDMRLEIRKERNVISPMMQDAIESRLQAREQVILFVNRRGYAGFILCRDCGYVAYCPNCAVSLSHHAARHALLCHHCGHFQVAPETCPTCQGTRIQGFGVGTEKVEEAAAMRFPTARIVRMDRDTTTRKGSHAEIISKFRDGHADILVGTQMVAKGLDFPNVTLVGVISADNGLHMSDFRASERAFQLLCQVSGRAGRGEKLGEVMIQSFTPEHPAIVLAARQDYREFYSIEIPNRRELGYPPFRRFVVLTCTSRTEPEARAHAEEVASAIRKAAWQGVEVVGPTPAQIVKLNQLFRWRLELRCATTESVPRLLAGLLSDLSLESRRSLAIDVDPERTI